MNWKKIFARAVENWPAKVLSIGLAIILFVFHRMSLLETRFFYVPLHVENLGAMMPANSYPRMIRISLRGEAGIIYSVLEEDIDAYVDMSGFSSRGTYHVPVQWRTGGVAQGLESLQVTVEPMEIPFVLDHRISKLVPLTANFRGQVDSGYTLDSYYLNPDHVIIDGPAELVAGIYELHTDYINMDGRISSFSEFTSVPDTNPLIVIRGDGRVEFQGSISRLLPVRNIPVVPVIVTGLNEGLRAELETVFIDLNLEGENRENVDRFMVNGDFVRIDCSGITEPGTYVLNVLTGSVPGLRFRAEPNEITVRISVMEDQ